MTIPAFCPICGTDHATDECTGPVVIRRGKRYETTETEEES